jgi:hypothetical protein
MPATAPLAATIALLLAAAPPPPPPIVIRGESRLNDATIRITITEWSGWILDPSVEFPASQLGLSLIVDGPSSRIPIASLDGSVRIDGTAIAPATLEQRLQPGIFEGNRMATVSLPGFAGQAVQWETSFRVESFNVRTDETRASAITWPREWPDELQRFREAEPLIESNDPAVQTLLREIAGGSLRQTPPFIAAKGIVRAAALLPRNFGSVCFVRGPMGSIGGIEVHGALPLIANGTGTPADTTCLAVALLRAAGIPARPVLSVTRYNNPKRYQQNQFGSGPWVHGEFWLPEAGWIPFDPVMMRRQALRQMDLRRPWRGFASFDDLNELVPLAWSFLPPPPLQPAGWPAMWGSSLPGLATGVRRGEYGQSWGYLSVGLVNRGRGPGD